MNEPNQSSATKIQIGRPGESEVKMANVCDDDDDVKVDMSTKCTTRRPSEEGLEGLWESLTSGTEAMLSHQGPGARWKTFEKDCNVRQKATKSRLSASLSYILFR